jgi:putative endonuclease
MSFYVYILKSEIVEKFYIGSTSNLEKRIELHNSPRARWTKKYQPWVLIHSEEFNSRSEAVKREKFLKSLKGIEKKLDLIKENIL